MLGSSCPSVAIGINIRLCVKFCAGSLHRLVQSRPPRLTEITIGSCTRSVYVSKIKSWPNELPGGLGYAIMHSRLEDGTPACSNADVLRWLLEKAREWDVV